MKKTLALALILTLSAPAFGLGEARAEGFSITQWSARGMALGNGMVEKISLNLSSDKAEVELKYELK